MRTHLRGLVFGFAQSVPFFAYCGCMYYGGILVHNEGLEYKKVFRFALKIEPSIAKTVKKSRGFKSVVSQLSVCELS